MQFSKKLFTATITALLLVSAVATIIPVFAFPTGAVANLSVATGPVGQAVTITGVDTDAPGSLLTVYWENTGGQVLGTNYTDGAGAYSIRVTIPDAAYGTHFIIVQDIIPSTVSAAFVVTSKITLSPTSGIPGDVVTVTGSGFSGNSTGQQRNVTINFSNATGTVFSQDVAAVNASSTGNFTVTFNVPAVDYGPYTVTATDQATGGAHSATASFTASAAIIVSPTSGPSGTVVTINGRGFSHIAGLAITTSVGGVTAPQVAPIVTSADGTISGQIVVPTLTTGNKDVVAQDPNFTATLTAGFRVTATTTVTVIPTSAAPGNAVTLTGSGFAAIDGTAVTIRFGQTAGGTLQVATFTTTSGNFSGSVTVPNLPTSPPIYYFNGTDAYNLTAATTFSIAITALFLTPTSGPTGSLVSSTSYGLGITGGTTFNLTINGALVTPSTTTLAGGGAATTATFTVPTLPVGTYNVVATDNLGLQASTTFVVTATSTLTVNPSTAPVGVSGITLTLTNFGATVPVTFYISNATNAYPLTVNPGSPVTNATGAVVVTFTVPGLALGSYTILANESALPSRFNATVVFTVGAATLNISPRATTYAQGDILSFKIESTFAADFGINIYDPQGTPGHMEIYSDNFVFIGNLWVYPYAVGSMWGWTESAEWVIPNDAPTGTWTWNASIPSLSAIKSGSFTVVLAGASGNVTTADLNKTLTTISQKLDLINATVIAINGNLATVATNMGYIMMNLTAIGANVTSIKGTVATVQTTLGTVQTTVNSINANITSINNGFATVQTSVGTLTTTVNSISSTLSSVSGTVGTISTSVGSLSTDLSSINTKVTSIQGTVATIQTDLGTLTGTVTSIQGNVATIQTDIGTLQADVGTLQTSVNDVPGQVNIPIWIAVVLALIAALAAIASLLLVRRKIAG